MISRLVGDCRSYSSVYQLLTLFVNIRSINDDEYSVKCVGSSIICARLNLVVKRELILVQLIVVKITRYNDIINSSIIYGHFY